MSLYRNERKKYYKHQKKAEKDPGKYMSIIIDGMDQAKTYLPHWIQSSKVFFNTNKFRFCYNNIYFESETG